MSDLSTLPIPLPACTTTGTLAQITQQQLIALALDKAAHELNALVEIRCNDNDWCDDDVDVDNTVELLLSKVRQLIAGPELTLNEFEKEWYQLISVLNLAVNAFSRPDTYYFRSLKSLSTAFEVLIELVQDTGAEVAHV